LCLTTLAKCLWSGEYATWISFSDQSSR
jgi:hypothetical protein